MKKVSIASIPWGRDSSPTRKFGSRYKNISLALGAKKDTPPAGGGHPFDLQMRSVRPGSSVCPYHSHSDQWELFIILAGTGSVRADGKRHPVRAGEAFIQPPGTAHQITNTGRKDLVFYIIASNQFSEYCYYPDSDKWLIKPARKLFRMTEVDYFDGEDGKPA